MTCRTLCYQALQGCWREEQSISGGWERSVLQIEPSPGEHLTEDHSIPFHVFTRAAEQPWLRCVKSLDRPVVRQLQGPSFSYSNWSSWRPLHSEIKINIAFFYFLLSKWIRHLFLNCFRMAASIGCDFETSWRHCILFFFCCFWSLVNSNPFKCTHW